jgi:gluconolactonase
MTIPTASDRPKRGLISRRAAIQTAAAVAGAAALASGFAGNAAAQSNTDYDPGDRRYPDPDIIILDPRFANYRVGNTPIQKLWSGALWSEGPAWSGVGKYLLWSDIPNNRQLRWLEDTGEVSVFRNNSGNSNGNTFDWQGRQISCEHGNRRVVRYEHNGDVTVIADSFEGKPLNSPNDAVVHPNGSIWFTDPPYGTRAPGGYEGTPGGQLHLPNSVYRVDPTTGQIARVANEAEFPNGICFARDYDKLLVVDTAPTASIKIWDVVDGTRLANGRIFSDLKFNDTQARSDGIRSDIDGNIWASAAGGPGIDGVQVFTIQGERIGQILLPERCANIAFGGQKRNRLFMAASQSLFSLYVNTRGSHFC